MKKIYTVVAAMIFLSLSAFSQQYSSNVMYANSGVQVKANSAEQMYLVGNPVRSTITLQISNPNATKYELSLYSTSGKKVSTMLYEHPAGVSTKSIDVAYLHRGVYFLVATSQEGRRTLQVLLQ